MMCHSPYPHSFFLFIQQLPEGTPLNGLLVTDYNLPRGPILPAKILSTARLLLGHPAVKLDLIYRDMVSTSRIYYYVCNNSTD